MGYWSESNTDKTRSARELQGPGLGFCIATGQVV